MLDTEQSSTLRHWKHTREEIQANKKVGRTLAQKATQCLGQQSALSSSISVGTKRINLLTVEICLVFMLDQHDTFSDGDILTFENSTYLSKLWGVIILLVCKSQYPTHNKRENPCKRSLEAVIDIKFSRETNLVQLFIRENKGRRLRDRILIVWREGGG